MSVQQVLIDLEGIDPDVPPAEGDPELDELAAAFVALGEVPVRPVVFRRGADEHQTVWGHQAVRAAKLADARTARFEQLWVVELSTEDERATVERVLPLIVGPRPGRGSGDDPTAPASGPDALGGAMRRIEGEMKALVQGFARLELAVSPKRESAGDSPVLAQIAAALGIRQADAYGFTGDPVRDLLCVLNGDERAIKGLLRRIFKEKTAAAKAAIIAERRAELEAGFTELGQVQELRNVTAKGTPTKSPLLDNRKLLILIEALSRLGVRALEA